MNKTQKFFELKFNWQLLLKMHKWLIEKEVKFVFFLVKYFLWKIQIWLSAPVTQATQHTQYVAF